MRQLQFSRVFDEQREQNAPLSGRNSSLNPGTAAHAGNLSTVHTLELRYCATDYLDLLLRLRLIVPSLAGHSGASVFIVVRAP